MKTMTHNLLLAAVLLLNLTGMGLQLSAAEPENGHAKQMAQSLNLFTDKVRTIFSKQCLDCHGGEKTRSEFDLATRRGLLAGGEPLLPASLRKARSWNTCSTQRNP